MLDAGLAAHGEPVDVWPTDPDSGSSEGQRLDDVGSAANARIEDDRCGTRRGDDVGQQVDCRDTAVGLSAAMVRAVDAVHAVVDRHAGVVGSVDALEQEGEVGERADPVQVVPRHAGVAEAERPRAGRRLQVVLGRSLELGAEHRIGEVVGKAEALELGEAGQRQIPGAPTECERVERDDDGGEPGGLGAADEALAHLPITRWVELEPTRCVAELGSDVLHRILHQRRRDHRYAACRSRSGGGEVAVTVAVAKSDHPDGGQHQWRVVAVAEHLDGYVPLGRAPEHPWHEAPSLERGDVGALSVLVARAAAHVGPDLGAHRIRCPLLELVEGHR